MSSIVLSASVRQNLLSLQSTADLLATTQNRLATGKKVNTALDNPSNFFTAASLDSRASDINSLLDGVGNGVQVLQAANTGISSLQKLVDTAKSIANQALQTQVGYTKSKVSSTGSTGVSANDLLGTTAAVTSTVTGGQLSNNATATFGNSVVAGATVVDASHITAYTSTTATAGAQLYSAASTNADGTTVLSALTDNLGAAAGIAATDTLVVNGNTITFGTGTGALTSTGTNTYSMGIGTTLDDLTAAINTLQGGSAAGTDTGGVLTLQTGTDADLAVTGNAAAKLGLGATAANTATRGGGVSSTPPITGGTLIGGTSTAGGATDHLASAFTTTDTITVNGSTVAFYDSGAGGAAGTAANTTYLDLASATIDDVLNAVDTITGATGANASNVATGAAAGKINLSTGTAQDLDLGGTGAAKLGLSTGTTARLSTPATAPAITGATKLSGAVGTDALQTGFTAGQSISVNGTTINFVASGATGNDVNITDDVSSLLAKIDVITGGTGSSVVNGRIQLNAGTAADLVLGDSSPVGALAQLGLTAGTTAKSTPADAGLTGKTLTIGATGGGVASSITFGVDDAAGEVSTLDELNAKLAANNLQASINTSGAITLTTTNDAASFDIGALGGTITAPGGLFSGATIANSVKDPNSQATRASLVSQYNNVIDQIRTTAQDSSFNGINLLNGDQLKLVFNETGTSTLNITGVTFDPAGLGLGSLVSGTDFVDNSSTNKILTALNDASNSLRSQASALGSNLSVVQIRQDFSKNLINVLQTGSSNLTLADTNEEAANSQALSTRQSIAVSALALANQSQQSVLQLLR